MIEIFDKTRWRVAIAKNAHNISEQQKINAVWYLYFSVPQGAMQIYSQALQANCDKFFGAAMDFFIPEEIWRIYSCVLKFTSVLHPLHKPLR